MNILLNDINPGSGPPVVLLDRFEVKRTIGKGGMGVVYEAYDNELHAPVALKTLSAMSAESLLMFKREFRIFQNLNHPNLCNLGELLSAGDQWFFSMELINGENFLEYVRSVPLRADDHLETVRMPKSSPALDAEPTPEPTLVRSIYFNQPRLKSALCQVARGLLALHDAGTVHRDVKPSNVLVSDDDRVVILDYGVATYDAEEQL